MKVLRALLRTTGIAGVFALALPGAAFAQEATYPFNIPAEPLTTALQDVARVSGKQIIFTDKLTAGKSTTGLHGEFTVDEAMKRLLRGTDLAASEASSGGIVVQSKKVQAASNEGAAEGVTPDIEEVVVTGTHLAGGVSSSSPVISCHFSA